jgi:hypothetical protein
VRDLRPQVVLAFRTRHGVLGWARALPTGSRFHPRTGSGAPMASSPRPLLPSARTGRPSTATCNRGCLLSQRRCGSARRARRARCASRCVSDLGPRTPGHIATAPARPSHRAGDRQPVPDGWASRLATSGRTGAARSESTYLSPAPTQLSVAFRRLLLKGLLLGLQVRSCLAVAGRRIHKVHDLGSSNGPLTRGSAGA